MSTVASRRAGVTLVELMVTLVVLGIVLGVTTLTLAGEHKTTAQGAPSLAVQVMRIRTAAITEAAPREAVVNDHGDFVLVTALPDGRVLGRLKGLDELAGTVRSRQ